MSGRQFKFYHADRCRSLSEGMILTPQPNGLSLFGSQYGPRLASAEPNEDEALSREWYAEGTRQVHFPNEPSRLICIFGANTIWEAEQFAHSITPQPSEPIPIFEIFAAEFTSHDMNWLDYDGQGDKAQIAENMKRYWWREISNHMPAGGDRRAPRIEVKMTLPVTVGRIVSWVKFIS